MQLLFLSYSGSVLVFRFRLPHSRKHAHPANSVYPQWSYKHLHDLYHRCWSRWYCCGHRTCPLHSTRRCSGNNAPSLSTVRNTACPAADTWIPAPHLPEAMLRQDEPKSRLQSGPLAELLPTRSHSLQIPAHFLPVSAPPPIFHAHCPKGTHLRSGISPECRSPHRADSEKWHHWDLQILLLPFYLSAASYTAYPPLPFRP